MKTLKIFITAAVCSLFAACQNGDWDEPGLESAPFGNNSIQETNVITIQQLIDRYPNVFASTDQNALIEDDIQIKGWVTGNDVGGNLYKQFCLQDASRGIIISVNQGGMNGFLPEGQEILVDLKGLYIGGYRKQPQLGAPYNGNSIGRMSKDIWNQHFKIIGNINNLNPDVIAPVDFDDIKGDQNANCAKLVTIKNVKFEDADGKSTFAPQGESNTNRTMEQNGKSLGSNIVVRTSSYADFAAMKLPYDTVAKAAIPCNITGIATRYNATWQILIRKSSDIQIIK
jgi:hypothetical protein